MPEYESEAIDRPTAAAEEPVTLQRRYYAATADRYDDMHERGEHLDALELVADYMRLIDARSVLDTGCGTGLAMRHLLRQMPELAVRGNDPSSRLLEIAASRYGIPSELLDEASSDALPYGDGEFDAVVETGVLHHVPDPSAVISEMMRVAGKAVFISDSNAYGMGGPHAGLIKLMLSRLRLLRPLNRRRRGGHDWYYTEGDGVAWTYSVFDSIPLVRSGCKELRLTPLRGEPERLRERWPRLFASNVLLAAFKEPLAERRTG